MTILGIDIGGTGIKGAPVDIENGVMLAPRFRLLTPHPAKPNPVAATVAELVQHFDWHGLVGVGFPAVIIQGVARSAANIHKKWIGTDVAALLGSTTGCTVRVANDADAAGLAEMAFGAGQGRQGVVVLVTIGTGLGTAVFANGHLVPNTELGHVLLGGVEAEVLASDAARKREKLSWKKWARRLNRYLNRLESLLAPDLFILGGGVSKKYTKFLPYLNVNAEVIPAQMLNEAGIVGAALVAQQMEEQGG